MEGIVVTFPSVAPQEVPRWADQQGHRALSRVQMGELSAGRQALEGAELAPGNAETLRQLRLRPSTPREPLPHHIAHHVPDRPFELDEK